MATHTTNRFRAGLFGPALALSSIAHLIAPQPAALAQDGCEDNYRKAAQGLEEARAPSGGVTTGRQIWARWDCRHCGTKRNTMKPPENSHQPKCQHCGKPFSAAEGDKYYLGEKLDSQGRVVGDENVVKGDFEKKLANEGRFWSCKYCQVSNRAGKLSCASCGSPKAEGTPQQIASDRVKVAAQGSELAESGADSGDSGDSGDPGDGGGDSGDSEARKRNVMLGVAGGAAAAAAGYGIYWGFQDHPVEGQVNGGSWKHVVHLEEDRIVGGSGFRDELPGGAFNIRDCSMRHHHYEKYQCGTTQETRTVYDQVRDGEDCSYSHRDNGNGSFSEVKSCSPRYRSVSRQVTETVPKYCDRSVEQSYCSYDIHKWIEVAAPSLGGGPADKGTRSLAWPSVTPASNQRTIREARYELTFSYKDGKETKTSGLDVTSEGEFLSWPMGATATVYVRNFGGITHVEHKDGSY